MRTTGRQPHRRSKAPVILVVAVIVLAAALAVGYFLWRQTQGVIKTGTVSGENETVASSAQNTVEYEGSTYTYNDHLSNYLFMGRSQQYGESDGRRAGRFYLCRLA